MSKPVVLITGASSGIGEATARHLAQQGSLSLVLVARNQQKLDQLAQELSSKHAVDVVTHPFDLTQVDAISECLQVALQHFGRLDVVLHVAGAADFKPALDFTPQEIEREFQLNTLSGIRLSQVAAQQMLQQGGGKIIIVASMSGKLPTPQSSVYAASKSAMMTYAAVLGMELEDSGVQVTVVNPGPVKTAFFDHSPAMQTYIQNVERFALEAHQVAKLLAELVWQTKKLPYEVNLPFAMRLAHLGHRMCPRLARWLTLRFANFK